MQHTYPFTVLALAMLADAQAFKGSPAGAGTPPTTLSFPNCAKSCLDTPEGNFVDQIQAFCKAVPTIDCCITNACALKDKDLTYRISAQICAYIGASVASFTCAPKSTTAATVQRSSPPGLQQDAAVASSTTLRPSSHSISQTSTPRSHSTSTHSSSPSSTHSSSPSSTHSTLLTSVRSSSPSSTTPHRSTTVSSTSTAPAAAHSTLSTYDGFVGAYCYSEGTSGRALTGASTTSANMTIESCLTFCEKEGYGWAGVENSDGCYCGFGMSNGGARTDDSACNLGCSGNPTENCGGAKALSVYQSG